MYKLLVGGYASRCFEVRGKVGPNPDRRFQWNSLFGQCNGSRLPDYLDQLEFRRDTFGEPSGKSSRPLPMTAFNDMGDFHVVAEQIKDFIVAYSGAAIETAPVRTTELDGSPTEHRYYALKVLETVECIDPMQSVGWRRGRNVSNKVETFSDMVDECELVSSLCCRFANYGPDRYKSYPGWGAVSRLKLVENVIPKDLKLFHPTYWPGQLLIEELFATKLSKLCFQPGYEFWTLDLDDPQKDHDRLLHGLR